MSLVPPNQSQSKDWNNEIYKGANHRGALVIKSAAQTTTTAVTATLTWSSSSYDTSGIFSTSSNTKLFVPAGIRKVVLRCNVEYSTHATGYRQTTLTKNGSSHTGMPVMGTSGVASNQIFHNLTSPVLQVEDGDYFEVTTNQTSGGNLDINASNTWFEMQIIG